MKKIIIIISALIITLFGLFWIYSNGASKNTSVENKVKDNGVSAENKILSSAVSIPEKVLSNRFGFLGGQEEENPFVGDVGGAWMRPHPGPFLWDSMQKDKNGKTDFSKTDKIVVYQQSQNYGTLATIWPFAEWDQKMRDGSDLCAVSNKDEFLSQNDKKGRGDYLPLHRCNPTNWEDYKKWVYSMVERYDGDGIDDMPNLKIPIKYWEVMNEPDLSYGNNAPDKDRLTFYKEGPKEYAKLLIQTSEAIRSADQNAKILIAGAAGADKQFLDFYREALSVNGTKDAFDIGNVHCISNDQGTSDFNVGAYKKMLAEFKISKPIWVTEAESFNGKTAEENYELTKKSTMGAISAGAEKIFYTRYNFNDFRTDMSQKNVDSEESIRASEKQYQSITSQF